MRKIYFLFLLFFSSVFPFASGFMFSQEHLVKWYTEADGLPTRYIDFIEIDNLGNVFLGSYLGLTVYDGRIFKNYTTSEGLPSPLVRTIHRDEFGRVWIFTTANKLCIFENGKIKKVSSFNSTYYKWNEMFLFYPYHKDRFIVDYLNPRRSLTYKRGPRGWKLIRKSEAKDSVSFDFRNPTNREEVIWNVKNKRTKDSIQILLESKKKHKTYRFPFPDEISYFCRLITKKASYYSFWNTLFELNSNGELRSKKLNIHIATIVEGINKTLWLKTYEGNIIQVSLKNFEILSSYKFSTFKVIDFRQDKFGGLWLRTTKGLGYLPHKPHKNYQHKEYFASEVNQFCFIGDTILIGHANGDVGYFTKEKKESLIYTSPYREPFNLSEVSSFIVEKSGDIIFTSYRHGIFRINRKTLKVKQLSSLGSTRSTMLANGTILIPNYLLGITQIKNGKLEDFEKGRLKNINCFHTLEISKNNILIAARGGLWQIKNSVLRQIQIGNLSDVTIKSFAKLKDNKIVVGTFGNGVTIFAEKDTIRLTIKNGLSSNFINDIYVDEKNRIWLATTNGISIVTRKRSMYHVQKISGTECLDFDNFFIKKKNDEIWIASNEGLMKVNEREIAKTTDFYPLHIRELLVDTNVVNHHQAISFTYERAKKIVLRYKMIIYDQSHEIEYFYRILGQNKRWYAIKGEELILSNLNPKKYKVQLYARFKDSNLQSNVVELNINVLPQFWQKPIFFLLVIALCCFLIFLYIKFLLKKQKENYSTRLKIAGLQANVIRAQMNPHFMFNAINSIQSFILANENRLANYYLGKFSSLLRNVIEISKNDFVQLQNEIELLKDYIELEKMRCDDRFGFEINLIMGKEKTDSVEIPTMIIQPFVENAILHGLSPLEGKKGKLEVSFEVKEKNLVCTIQDNGIGREEARKLKERKSKYHQSASISLTEERIKLYNNLYLSDAKIEILDLTNEQGEALGTKVIIHIPILNKYEI